VTADTIAAKPKVAVLMGGRSAERAVSLNTGGQVGDALGGLGWDVVSIDTGEPDFIPALAASGAGVVFICLHGRLGEDGTVQGLLELMDLPYVGSGVLASALAMDKVMCKHVFACEGLRTPEYVTLRRGEPLDFGAVISRLGSKVVVKPASEGSAIGVHIVHDASELPEAIAEAFSHDDVVLVERFVEGVEVTVGVLGNEAPQVLPTLEIVPEHEFYDYESKYVPGMSSHIIPARVSEEARAECSRLSERAHIALGCRGLSRADTIVTVEGDVYLLEVNTIPGMTSTSLFPDAARAAGIEFPQLCERLVELAVENWESRTRT
jgi:D-alanine-D-alanine ligase